MTPTGRAGVTLVELVIALAIMAMLLAVSAASFAGLRTPEPDPDTAAIARGRRQAILSGRPVTIDTGADGSSGRILRFLPSGRVIGAGIDPWTGRITNEIR